ncbi:ribbon-helix-helix protein, CopG family [Methanobacterium sp.]|uniref:ribbon-helix-helix protein, CopG family n=1 Tax=Methanobacterium sp. TaxID=2164 RepID=UPI00315939CE
MAKQKMKQITIKLSERQIKGLEELAEEMGDQPISVIVRIAVASYLKENGKI